MFYVGGPGRTHGETRLGQTDWGLAEVRLLSVRPGQAQKATSECVLNVRPPLLHVMSPLKSWLSFISLNRYKTYSKITCSTSHDSNVHICAH